jgi:hypothetical protein
MKIWFVLCIAINERQDQGGTWVPKGLICRCVKWYSGVTYEGVSRSFRTESITTASTENFGYTLVIHVSPCGSPRSPVENSAVSRYMLRLAERVAESGEVLNVAECLEVEKGSGGNIKSLLAMPVRNRHYQIIGKSVTERSSSICASFVTFLFIFQVKFVLNRFIYDYVTLLLILINVNLFRL